MIIWGILARETHTWLCLQDPEATVYCLFRSLCSELLSGKNYLEKSPLKY